MKILILLILGLPFAIFGQSKIYIIGKIEDLETKKGIKSARIYNTKAKAGSVSNDRGLFFIWALPNDSVTITAKGYKSSSFICKTIAKDTTFSLVSDPTYVTELDEVIVQGKKSEQMKKEIKELMLENPGGVFDAGSLISTNTLPGTTGAGISIDAIYDYFSKSGKDHRKAEYLAQQERYKYYANWRLNHKLVTRLTGLVGNELLSFLEYMKLDQSYILKASDYELHATIKTYYNAFKGTRAYFQEPK